MMVEKVPDSTYEMVGGLQKQIKEIKEVIELQSNILNYSTHWVLPSQRVSCSMDLQVWSITQLFTACLFSVICWEITVVDGFGNQFRFCHRIRVF